MLHGHFQQVHGVPAAGDGRLPAGLAFLREIFLRQGVNSGVDFPLLLQHPKPPEGDGAAVEGGIFFWTQLVLGDDAEGGPRLLPEGIQLVALPGAVEIQPPLQIKIAEGDSVGPALVPRQGQNAGGTLPQDGGGFLLGELPLLFVGT